MLGAMMKKAIANNTKTTIICIIEFSVSFSNHHCFFHTYFHHTLYKMESLLEKKSNFRECKNLCIASGGLRQFISC